MNRLHNETSPYLRQHADNPVHWHPWGQEAFAQAAAEDKPVFLSIGYSSCHWCHVMAHESFEDAETADYLNTHFVSVKVDREERPDVDDIYMRAVQQMTRGHGGWPLTVFLTPGGDPFYGGTYFPLEPRYGMPSFRQILEGVTDAYENRREEVDEAGRDLAESLDRDFTQIIGDRETLSPALLESARRILIAEWDKEHGGFHGAPKFPQPMNLAFLLRSHQRTGDPRALQVVTHSLKKMAAGGIYDQVGGGFARYSTDAYWLVPHFEKMLYDNAQLSRLYLHTWQITGDHFFKRIAEDIYDYILREMTAPEGGFYSATDADSEGEEGKFFVWGHDELEHLLGEDAPLLLSYWGVTPGGNFEGRSILYLPHNEADFAARVGISVDELRAKVAAGRAKLYAARARRVPPLLDDKILTAWNGLMLASLAEAARVLNRDDYRDAAIKNGDFLLNAMMTGEGRLWRTHRAGQSKLNAYLEDYSGAIEGLLELYQTTFDVRWFSATRRLADFALDHFAAGDGSFFDTSNDHEPLLVRPRNFQDNAVPSGSSLLARGLLRLAAYTAEPRYSAAAEASLSFMSEMMRRVPQGFGEALGAADLLIHPLKEVAVVGDPADARTQALLEVIQGRYRPDVVTALAAENVEGEHTIPLLSYRKLRGGVPTVYVCEGFACQMPVTTPDEVAALLAQSEGETDDAV